MNPAFIVDGFTERNIIHNICPGATIKRTDLNGKDVTIEAMAKKIGVLIRLLSNRNYPIVILADRESRNISCNEMSIKLEESIKKEGIGNIDLRVGVADQMLENWIIAGLFKAEGNKNENPTNTDGLNGSSELKKRIGPYGKTTEGVAMFLKADVKEMYKNSASFRAFADKLTGLKCDYIDKIWNKNV